MAQVYWNKREQIIYFTRNFDEKLVIDRFLKKYMFCDDVLKITWRTKSLGERIFIFVKSYSFSIFFSGENLKRQISAFTFQPKNIIS